MVFDVGVQCAGGLVLLAAVLLGIFTGKIYVQLDEETRLGGPDWAERLAESKAGTVIQVLLAPIIILGVGGAIGVLLWGTFNGIYEIALAQPAVLWTAIVGATASMISCALLALLASLFGPILSAGWEVLIVYIAPIVGATVGAAIGGGLPINLLFVLPLGALAGGVAAPVSSLILAKEGTSLKTASQEVTTGLFLGAILGAILTGAFKLLELTVGLDWLLTG